MIGRDELEWSEGNRSFRLRGWDYVSAHWQGEPASWVPGENCFLVHKTRLLIDLYLKNFADLQPHGSFDNVVELGLFDGGSIPFWIELLHPKRHLGLDVRDKTDPPYLRRYLAEKGLEERVRARWRVDTTSRRWVPHVLEEHFGDAPLDVVIDDASHQYESTRQSFEMLFPRVRPRGLYVIEDWAWSHWVGNEKDWAGQRPLSRLITELVEAAGSSREELVESIHVCCGFTVLRRGYTPREELEGFSLDDFIYRHPR